MLRVDFLVLTECCFFAQSLVHMSKIRLPSVLIHRHDPASPTHRHPHHPVSATAGDHIAPLSYTAVPSEEPRTTVASAPAATTFCLKEASFNEQVTLICTHCWC